MTKQQQQEKFTAAYNTLNPEQRLAVDTTEGPVMVIAGPGTGKTQILSARIGKILNDTDAQPENILCLTYTDAGVVAMRKRLLQFIGADAYKVNIYTFHAFCNDVIQDNLALFEKTALDAISELESIELFTDLINGFEKDNPLKRYRGDVYFEINNLKSLFSTMKKEGWTAGYINACIDEYLADIKTRDEFVYKKAYKQFKAGDLKQNKIDEENEKMGKLRAAVNEFANFQELMRQRNRYDFDDMINWVIKAFEENPFLLMNYQEQFQYLLVDEYQDTSGTQNKIVALLMGYWDVPNVFVVGDDDQSIYRFQGANVENMLAFAQQYEKDLLKVVLTSNYRSTQPILNISKTLIERNYERLVNQVPGLSKDLKAANAKYTGITHLPLLKEYDTQRHEMIDITLQVEKLLHEGVLPGKIGVIYKENKYGEELATYFKLKNIPFYSKRSQNLLAIPFAQKIILLLRYLAAEHDAPYGGDEMLFEILHFDWLHIPAIDIAKLSVEVSGRLWGANKTSLRGIIAEKKAQPMKDLFSFSIHPSLVAASNLIEQLISDVPNMTLQQLVGKLVKDAGVLPYIMEHEDKIWLLQIVTAFFDFIKEETRRNPFISLKEMIKVLELMDKEQIALPIVQVSGSDKGINLLTAHGSKGLEFEYVFFAGANASNWEKKRKPGGGYSLPDTMFSSQPKDKDNEELRRLFYVALTRAEKQLAISYSKYKMDGKALEPSMFIAEIQEEHPLQAETVALGEAVVFEFNALVFDKILAPEIGQPEADFITRLLDGFAMNVTALSNYLNCPLKFYYNNLIRIPSSKNEATEFGSAIHFALEQLFKKMQNNNDTFPIKDVFVRDFSWYMHRHREFFTKEQYDRRMEYGYEVLGNYYDTYINRFPKVVSVERMIRNVLVKGIPLKGKLDKLEFNGKEVTVVDYKSGDVDKAKAKLLPPLDKEPNGGDYWRQAVFYKLLLDNYDLKDWKVTAVEFDFIEPDKKKNYQKSKVVVTPEDITTVTQQITTVWEKIQNRDFYTGCGKPDCHWCNFVKNNSLAIALHEIEEEG
ncbi:ATP-dependent helicase [Parasediminibacterium sp. JCM 36343]|uniref:ATP-dependent helicase n=1 Tax=Parasediminibacterium sp. JCM 36343 TaxID=3374279 RepID=UPI00397CC9A7